MKEKKSGKFETILSEAVQEGMDQFPEYAPGVFVTNTGDLQSNQVESFVKTLVRCQLLQIRTLLLAQDMLGLPPEGIQSLSKLVEHNVLLEVSRNNGEDPSFLSKLTGQDLCVEEPPFKDQAFHHPKLGTLVEGISNLIH